MSGLSASEVQALLTTEQVLRKLAEYLKHSHEWERAQEIGDEGESESLMAEADGELSKLSVDHVLLLAEQNTPQVGGYYTQQQAQMYLDELGAVCEMLGLNIDESHEIVPAIATFRVRLASQAAELDRLRAQAAAVAEWKEDLREIGARLDAVTCHYTERGSNLRIDLDDLVSDLAALAQASAGQGDQEAGG